MSAEPIGTTPVVVDLADSDRTTRCTVEHWHDLDDVGLAPTADVMEWYRWLAPGRVLDASWVTVDGRAFTASATVTGRADEHVVPVRLAEVSEQRRRDAARFPVGWSVQMAVLDGLVPTVVHTETRDICAHGIGLRTTRLRRLEQVAVAFPMPSATPVLAVARVVRVDQAAGHSGLRLTELTETHQRRLVQMLWTIQRQRARA